MAQDKPMVAVMMGSSSDRDVMKGCVDLLEEFQVPYEVKILSAHRTPDLTRKYVLSAAENGIEVIIAGAGWAAHLAGFVAGLTTLPVIGVPIDSSSLNGLDALLSTVQMPPGIPVATVAVGSGGARNAAVLATQILSLKYPHINERLRAYREDITEKTEEKADSWG